MPTLSLRMNDGRILTANGTDSSVSANVTTAGFQGVVGGSASDVGLYHIYAVPPNATSTTFNLVLQLEDGSATWPVDATSRDVVAPTGYTIYKYLGSWRAVDMSGTTKFTSFHTDPNGWFYQRNLSLYTVAARGAAAFTPAANTWYQCDGTTYVTNLDTTSPYIYCPRYATRALSLGFNFAHDENATAAQSAYIAGGESGTPPWTLNNDSPARVGLLPDPVTSTAAGHASALIIPLGSDGLLVGFGTTTPVSSYSVAFRGYQNTLYGLD